MSECCKDCIHCHRLEHNFKVGKGYEKSLACDVLHDLIVETTVNDTCEMFERKEQDELIRCEDCIYWERKGLDYGMCKQVDSDTIRMTSEDAYCSKGARA